MRQIIGVDGVFKDDETLKQELCDKVKKHIDDGDEILVPSAYVSKVMLKISAQWRKYEVVCKDEEHCLLYVGGALKGVVSVESKVPEHTQYQGDQIAYPVVQVDNLIHQGECADLDQPGRGCNESIFYRA